MYKLFLQQKIRQIQPVFLYTISCFHKLSCRGYKNKLKTTYGHSFHKFTQTISQILISVDKLG